MSKNYQEFLGVPRNSYEFLENNRNSLETGTSDAQPSVLFGFISWAQSIWVKVLSTWNSSNLRPPRTSNLLGPPRKPPETSRISE